MPLSLCQKKKKKKEKRTANWKVACLFVLVIAQLFFWWWCCAGVKSCQVDSGYWLLSLLFYLFCLKIRKRKTNVFICKKEKEERKFRLFVNFNREGQEFEGQL